MANGNPMKQNGNPYPNNNVTVTETFKPDGARQATLRGGNGSINVSQGADGNVTMTKSEQVDLSKVLPFTSLQPAAAAMDQIFGTKMAGAMPSQSQLIQNYRNLQGQEADPLDELRKQKLMLDIENYGQLTPSQQKNLEIRERQALANEKAAQARLAETQENRKLRKGLQLDKKVTDYAKWIDKSGIPSAVETLKNIERITATNEDLPGYGQTGMLPSIMLSQDGQDLRSSVQNLFNIVLKDRSGAAVSQQEYQRLREEFENSIGKGDDAVRRALQKYVDKLREDIRNIHGGVDPEAVDVYVEERGGRRFSDEISNMGTAFGGGRYQIGGSGGGSSSLESKKRRLEELKRKQAGVQ